MKALNRKEVLVNAKANGTLDSFKPLTRDEAFIKRALGLGGGDVAWEDIKNRPFGDDYPFEPIEWDGNTNGLVSAGDFYKVCDLPNGFTLEVCIASRNRSVVFANEKREIVDMIYDTTVGKRYFAWSTDNVPVVSIVFDPNVTINSNVFTETGIYFTKTTNGEYVSKCVLDCITTPVPDDWLPYHLAVYANVVGDTFALPVTYDDISITIDSGLNVMLKVYNNEGNYLGTYTYAGEDGNVGSKIFTMFNPQRNELNSITISVDNTLTFYHQRTSAPN